MTVIAFRRRSLSAARSRKMLAKQISEEQLQRAVVEHLRARAPKDVVYFHVPNGGKRASEIEVARFKAMGMVPGVPDLILGRFGRMYALELKARGKKPTQEQLDVMDWFRSAGIRCEWADNLDDALTWLAGWGLFDRRRMILDPDEVG